MALSVLPLLLEGMQHRSLFLSLLEKSWAFMEILINTLMRLVSA